jgi:tetratricopeptide (TPR) repeat protein
MPRSSPLFLAATLGLWSRFCSAALLLFFLPCFASAQRVAIPQRGSTPVSPTQQTFYTGSILVAVTAVSGSVLTIHPHLALFIRGLDSPSAGFPVPFGAGQWRFQELQVGRTYTIRVEARGYRPEEQYVILPNSDGATARVHIYLYPSGKEPESVVTRSRQFLLAPAAQREVQQAEKDLKSNKILKAQRSLKKALELAPAHPGVNYLMGLSYLRENQPVQAIPYLEKSVSVDPTQTSALLALAIVHYDQRDYPGAIQMLDRVVTQLPRSWAAQWILASCYLREKNYPSARQHAVRALKTGGKKANVTRLVLGEALAGLGRRQQAIATFKLFLKENPHNPADGRVRAMIRELRQPPAPRVAKEASPKARHSPTRAGVPAESAPVAAQPIAGPTVAPAPEFRARNTAALLPKENWAPPDVDAVRPAVVTGAACHLSQILREAGKQAVKWVKDLQEFSATEEYQSVEINHNGIVGEPFTERFRYLVSVDKIRPGVFTLDELRQPTPNLRRMGSPFIGLGAPGLALVFHPDFRSAFSWSCEGLGSWEDRPAWIVRFTQRTDRPIAPLLSWQTLSGSRLLAIQGIAWLSEKGVHVMHLETDLVEQAKVLPLGRDHFSIDYRLVKFHSHPVDLWLPERVDMYILYGSKAYHNYSRYSRFRLFWTSASYTTSKPK